jgi:hypothetical protein
MMSWQRYSLIFRLVAPLHIGYRKVGNLQQTRGYLPGKLLWAALTARLTRNQIAGATGKDYQRIGRLVEENIRFTYLYPALQEADGQYQRYYPWQSHFDYRFLSSYASTALDYSSQSAADALLHEVEFIRPYARPLASQEPKQTYLMGDLYVQEDSLPTEVADWQQALHQLQFGGERGYGWGRVSLVSCQPLERFDSEPIVSIEANQPITAHAHATGSQAVTQLIGSLEPLVGWERNNDGKRRWHLSNATICYTPGSRTKENLQFTIGRYGIFGITSPRAPSSKCI